MGWFIASLICETTDCRTLPLSDHKKSVCVINSYIVRVKHHEPSNRPNGEISMHDNHKFHLNTFNFMFNFMLDLNLHTATNKPEHNPIWVICWVYHTKIENKLVFPMLSFHLTHISSLTWNDPYWDMWFLSYHAASAWTCINYRDTHTEHVLTSLQSPALPFHAPVLSPLRPVVCVRGVYLDPPSAAPSASPPLPEAGRWTASGICNRTIKTYLSLLLQCTDDQIQVEKL